MSVSDTFSRAFCLFFAVVVEGWSLYGSVRLHPAPTLLFVRAWSPGGWDKHQPRRLWWNLSHLSMTPHGPGKITGTLEAMINPSLIWFAIWALAWSCYAGGNALDLETIAVSSVPKENDHHRRNDFQQLCTHRHACSSWHLAFIQMVPPSFSLACPERLGDENLGCWVPTHCIYPISLKDGHSCFPAPWYLISWTTRRTNPIYH